METNQTIQLGPSQSNKGPAAMPVPPSTPPKPPMPKKENSNGKKGGWVWAVIAVLAIAALTYYFIKYPAQAPAPSGEESGLEDENNEMGAVQEGQPTFLWEFSPAGGDNETGAERTAVTLTVAGEVRDLGVFDGSCLVINGSSWSLAQNELTGVICWFGGAGDEVGVFYENGSYVVKKGVIEEGIEGESGMRGNYETLFTL